MRTSLKPAGLFMHRVPCVVDMTLAEGWRMLNNLHLTRARQSVRNLNFLCTTGLNKNLILFGQPGLA